MTTSALLLEIAGLNIAYRGPDATRTILSDVSLSVAAGETVGIVGESGSGKSMTAKAVIGLLPPRVAATGSVRFDGRDILGLPEREMSRLRGSEVALLMQDPFTMLDPLMPCGAQIVEGRAGSKAEKRQDAIRRLAEVGIRDEGVADRYPFQLSGGMRQRVALAAALAADPKLLIADEPSTALDVTTQAEILKLLASVQQARSMALILITHDLRVAFSVCSRVHVFYAGRVLEAAPASALEAQPLHPYSLGLMLSEPEVRHRAETLAAIPGSVPPPDTVIAECAFASRCRWRADACVAARPSLSEVEPGRLSACIRLDEIRPELRRQKLSAEAVAAVPVPVTSREPLVTVEHARKEFASRTAGRPAVVALDDVSLVIGRNESVGLVGESGSGKTTLGRSIVGLETLTAGRIAIDGIDASNFAGADAATRSRLRRTAQIVFQDPYSSLNPRQSIGSVLGETLAVNGAERGAVRGRVAELLDMVGLPQSYISRYPRALSGGERQRVAIARALAVGPKLLVCDEPVSALDVSVQAQILTLFRELKDRLGLSYLFITHDLAVVRQVTERVYVLYRSQLVEEGTVDRVLDFPTHEYTRRLIASVPGSGAELHATKREPTRVRDPDMSDDLKLWYTAPATKWLAALPVGNGRLGGMVFGRCRKEWIQLNEETIWTGQPQSRLNPLALQNLPEMQRLIMAGKIREAQFLGENTMFGTPPGLTTYETLSNLVLLTDQYDEAAKDYRRELDLETGIARVEFTFEGTRFTREIFASAPADVIVIRLTADRPAALNFSTAFWRRYDNNYWSFTIAEDLLRLTGQAGLYGTKFETLVKIITEGGTVSAAADHQVVKGATSATIIVGTATDFRHKDWSAAVRKTVDAAAAKSYDELRAAAVADHQRLFNRVGFSVDIPAAQAELATLPTDQRLARCKAGADDDGLTVQMFHYGRYLLQSASRPGTLPTTLQGIWNDTVAPAWDSKFTININEEMHYWPAETTNLAETHHALFDLIDRMRVTGAEVARVHYGARGFVAHHNTDIWADCAPLDNVFCGLWPLGAGWLVLHMWEHYTFSLDREFLRDRAYPAMKEAAEFLIDLMFEDDQGRLMLGPTISPENAFKGPAGERWALCMSPAMDIQITRALFSHLIESSELLAIDADFAAELKALLPKLPPTRIDGNGRIAEWLDDVVEYEPGHRHNSHLFALYPDDQITPEATPDLAAASKRSLEFRIASGGAGPCWSRAWICGLWARLGEGDEVRKHLLAFLRESTDSNLFSMHPPQGSNPLHVFQLDGNLGYTAAVAESLMQSQAGRIKLLPALPAAWQSGHVDGLRARGGFELSLGWADGKLTVATIISSAGALCRVAGNFSVNSDGVAVAVTREGGELSFATEKGRSYRLTPA